MTSDEARRCHEQDQKVWAGTGDDYDTGRILELWEDGDGILWARVGWDSCQQSECHASALEWLPEDEDL